jgi:sulfide dehydrogenase cytochrome subunit
VKPASGDTSGRVPRPAFLRLARQLTLGGALAAAPAVAGPSHGEMLGTGCTGCHGPDGVSTGNGIPSIAGLDKFYLARAMVQFKNAERPSTIMGRIATGYTDTELRQMAKYFGDLAWSGWQGTPDAAALDEARRIHDEVCAECHEQEGRHQDREMPRIAGQCPDYLFLALLQYRDPQDKEKPPQPDKMLQALQPLSDEQLLALSRYYATQK